MESHLSRPSYQLFVGIDVAAITFTTTWMPMQGQIARPVRFDQTPEGITAFQQRLQALSVWPTTFQGLAIGVSSATTQRTPPARRSCPSMER